MSKNKANTHEDLDLDDAAKKLIGELAAATTFDANASGTTDKKFYEAQLAEIGTDLPTVRKIQDLHSRLVTAGTVVLGDGVVPLMKKNGDLKEGSLNIGIGRDSIQLAIRREHQQRNPSTGETTTVYGNVVAKYRATGTAGARGNLRTGRDYVSKMAASVLGG